ncbi:MAG: chemotaxis protein CheW [Candidatus Anoxymicrobium japonicum]|uniref:Chemotaxis protein CheW n=1 Tax=Candidatus Anoxymicrobium japonicum TaxID=2013648 RepID=A0A2N3G520_9ACTN|nr:MAG: chemotaxis protein CheW [Candidatus Anoxymicrobium japonicum]
MEDKGYAVGREMQLVAFKVGKEEFGVDVLKVEGVISLVDITRMPRAPQFVEGVINLRGQIIAVVNLASRLGIEASERGSASRIVVVEAGEVKVGLIVDSPEVININKDDVEASPTLTAGDVESSLIRGVVKIEERLLILLDVDGVLSEEERIDIDEISNSAQAEEEEE